MAILTTDHIIERDTARQWNESTHAYANEHQRYDADNPDQELVMIETTVIARCDVCEVQHVVSYPYGTGELDDMLAASIESNDESWWIGSDAVADPGTSPLHHPDDLDPRTLSDLKDGYVFCNECHAEQNERMGSRFLGDVELYSYAQLA